MNEPEIQFGKNQPCFIIAEAGVNHAGCVERAIELIDVAHAAGADGVKFQTFTARELVTAETPGADYQQRNLGRSVSQLEMLQGLELSHDDFRRLATYARSIGITFLSTPFDAASADFLEELEVPFYKLGSGELTHLSLLRHVARKGKPVILSTGMADLEEVRVAVKEVRLENDQVILLHCVSNYPANPRDLNLRAIRTLSEECNVPVGFSDHTSGTQMAPLAVAAGACVIEKHFTMSRDLPGPDHRASLEPYELQEMVASIREAEAALGDGVKKPVCTEQAVADAARRSWVAAVALPVGVRLSPEHLILRRPGTGLSESEQHVLLGRILRRPLAEGAVFSMEDFR